MAASPFHPHPGTLGLGAWESCSPRGWRSRDRAPGDTPALHTPTPMLRWMPRLGVRGGGGKVARTGQRAVTQGGADGGGGGSGRRLTFRSLFLIIHCWLLKAQ